jgi:hypothetical protein
MDRIMLAIVFLAANAMACIAEEQTHRIEISCARGDLVSVSGAPPYAVERGALDGFTTISISREAEKVSEFTVKEAITDKSLPAPQITVRTIQDFKDAPVRLPYHREPGALTLQDDVIVANLYESGVSYAIYGVSTKTPTVVSVAAGSISTSMWWATCKSVR